MTNDELIQLKALAISLNGWHWPDRKRDPETGVHYFGQWKEGEFYELGTIDVSTYTDDYADDIRLLKFFRAIQPSTILALIAKVESLAADAERYQELRKLSMRMEGYALHLASTEDGRTLDKFTDECVAARAAMAKEEV